MNLPEVNSFLFYFAVLYSIGSREIRRPVEYFHFPLLKHISCYTETGSSMRKTYQFRLYPNKNQEVKLNSTLSTCRRLYNDSLAERKLQAELNRLRREFDVCPWGKPEWVSCYEQQKATAANKTSYQKEVFSQVLQNVLKRVDRSFKNFFNGFGYPRFREGTGTIHSHTHSLDLELKMGK